VDETIIGFGVDFTVDAVKLGVELGAGVLEAVGLDVDEASVEFFFAVSSSELLLLLNLNMSKKKESTPPPSCSEVELFPLLMLLP